VDVALLIGQLYDDPIRTLFSQTVVLKLVPMMIINMSNKYYIYKTGNRNNKLPLMVIDVPATPAVGEIDKTDPIVHGVKRN